MIVLFNTGAHYTEYGQRIMFTVLPEAIVFIDFDRGIDGVIPLVDTQGLDVDAACEFMYRGYLYNQYRHIKLDHSRPDLGPEHMALEVMKKLGPDSSKVQGPRFWNPRRI